MISFQVEKWSEALPELRELFPLLWDEVAMDKGILRADCDEAKYAALENLNMLHLITARNAFQSQPPANGKLIGYHLSFVMPHMHYLNGGLFAFADMYFTRPEFRKGGLGAKLLCFMETSLRDRGVLKAYLSHKMAHDQSALFKALGWQPCDQVYCKVLQSDRKAA